MADLRAAAQQALEALCLWSAGHELDAVSLNNLVDRLESMLAQQAEPTGAAILGARETPRAATVLQKPLD